MAPIGYDVAATEVDSFAILKPLKMRTLFNTLSATDEAFVKLNVPNRCSIIKPVTPISACAFIRCAPGHICKNGRCVRTHPVCHRRCLKIACRLGQPCPVCHSIGCPRGWECKYGKCIRPPPRCYTHCTKVQCIRAPCPPLCRTIGCPFGYRCIFGRCVHPYPWHAIF